MIPFGMSHTGATEARIAYIADQMRRLEWRTGETGTELANAWGLSKSSLEKLSAAASKRVRAEVCDPEAVSISVGAALDRVMRDALADGDRRSVIAAAATWARITGVAANRPHPANGASPQMVIYLPEEDPRDLDPEDD